MLDKKQDMPMMDIQEVINMKKKKTQYLLQFPTVTGGS